ncbi:MAG: helix-hairpin-helix domain-containing protein [Pirellulales bacterium]
MAETRKLADLRGIGKAMLRDFERLGVRGVAQLARCDARKLYDRIGKLDGAPHDPCVLDTYACAIAQARDPDLPGEQCDWWWWSRRRKAGVVAKD